MKFNQEQAQKKWIEILHSKFFFWSNFRRVLNPVPSDPLAIAPIVLYAEESQAKLAENFASWI